LVEVAVISRMLVLGIREVRILLAMASSAAM
jgi:hypothetical protein